MVGLLVHSSWCVLTKAWLGKNDKNDKNDINIRGCIAFEFGLVWLDLHCFLQLSSAVLMVNRYTIDLIRWWCWAYSASM